MFYVVVKNLPNGTTEDSLRSELSKSNSPSLSGDARNVFVSKVETSKPKVSVTRIHNVAVMDFAAEDKANQVVRLLHKSIFGGNELLARRISKEDYFFYFDIIGLKKEEDEE